jgi:hypothetical protein
MTALTDRQRTLLRALKSHGALSHDSRVTLATLDLDPGPMPRPGTPEGLTSVEAARSKRWASTATSLCKRGLVDRVEVRINPSDGNWHSYWLTGRGILVA